MGFEEQGISAILNTLQDIQNLYYKDELNSATINNFRKPVECVFSLGFNNIPYMKEGIFSPPSISTLPLQSYTSMDISLSTPVFTNKTPTFTNNLTLCDTYNYSHSSAKVSLSSTKKNGSTKSTNLTYRHYANLDRNSAIAQAKNDPNLELLKGGSGWSVCSASFINDIPFARKGTSTLLDRICKQYNVNLTITSALGTKNSPHAKGNGSASHYNSQNPKLDFGGGLSEQEAEKLAARLRNTGYFSHIAVENDGGTYHIDAQLV